MIYFDKNSTNNCHEVKSIHSPFWDDLENTNNIYVSKIPNEDPTITKWILDEELDITNLNLPITHYWKSELEEEFAEYLKIINEININTEKFNILLCHSPKNIRKNKIIEEYLGYLKRFNVILCGHMHSGLIPHGLRRIPNGKGLAGPYNTIFPEYAYGLKKIENTTILTTGGVTKLATSVGPEAITNNHLFRKMVDIAYPPEIELLKIEGKEKIIQYK